MKRKRSIDVSHELVIKPWKGGVKLIRPKNSQPHLSIGNIFSQPFNVFFYDNESRFQAVNEAHASVYEMDSPYSFISKNPFSFCVKPLAKLFIENNQTVIKAKKTKICEEFGHLCTGKNAQALSFKSPVFSDDNDVIGIFGCAIIMGQQALSDSLSFILKLGIFNEVQQQSLLAPSGNLLFSQQEREFIPYLMRGCSAKEIGKGLNLSPRTVEFYIERMKKKANTPSKLALVGKLYQHFS